MSVVSFKCPNCGGELVFDPTTQKYKCEYCFSDFTQEELEVFAAKELEKASEEIIEEKVVAEDSGEEGNLYSCPSCGAEIVTDATTAATFCYYCHNPVVLAGKLSGEYLPKQIIPFKIDKKQAQEKFLSYVKSKKFVPKNFFNKKQIELLSGVYFPYWVCDCDIDGSVSGEAKKIRIWRVGDTEHTETKIYHVERSGNVHLEDIMRNALKKANHELVDGVLPFRMDEVKDFNMGYLSGFVAEKRDMEIAEFEQEISEEAKKYGENLLRDTVQGYTHVSLNRNTMKMDKMDWSYVMLPVWTVTYKGRDGKTYYYSMNGQTGNIYGELPISFARVYKIAGAIAAAVFAFGLIGGALIW